MQEHSDERHAVYKRKGIDGYMYSIRGTSDKNDLLPDAHIVTGTQHKSKDFQQSLARLEELIEQLGGEWSTSGHSLGGTKAMWIAEQLGLESYAFNPGFHSAADDVLHPDYHGHHVYIVKGDPVSNSLLLRDNNDLKVLDTEDHDPLKTHSSTNFVREEDR
jgi:hypothetical protein